MLFYNYLPLILFMFFQLQAYCSVEQIQTAVEAQKAWEKQVQEQEEILNPN